MKQVHVISARYGGAPKGAYISRANAEAACRAFGFDANAIVTVPLLDSATPEVWPFEYLANVLREEAESDDAESDDV